MSPVKPDYSWIVWKYDVKPNLMVCERCGDTYPIHTPVKLSLLTAFAGAFIKEHKKCPPNGASGKIPIQSVTG